MFSASKVTFACATSLVDKVVGFKAVNIRKEDGTWYPTMDPSMTFAPGGTYSIKPGSTLEMCKNGFHACVHPSTCLNVYRHPSWHVGNNDAVGLVAVSMRQVEVASDPLAQVVAEKITFGDRLLTPEEVKLACTSHPIRVLDHVEYRDENGQRHHEGVDGTGKPLPAVVFDDGGRLYRHHGRGFPLPSGGPATDTRTDTEYFDDQGHFHRDELDADGHPLPAATYRSFPERHIAGVNDGPNEERLYRRHGCGFPLPSGGPATDLFNRKEYFNDQGYLHRPGGLPAVLEPHAEFAGVPVSRESFYIDGLLQNGDDKPAFVERAKDTNVVLREAHYHHGRLHREGNKPALVVRDKDTNVITVEGYYRHGKLHRDDGGPASIMRDPATGNVTSLEWRVNGRSSRPGGLPSTLNTWRAGWPKDSTRPCGVRHVGVDTMAKFNNGSYGWTCSPAEVASDPFDEATRRPMTWTEWVSVHLCRFQASRQRQTDFARYRQPRTVYFYSSSDDE